MSNNNFINAHNNQRHFVDFLQEQPKQAHINVPQWEQQLIAKKQRLGDELKEKQRMLELERTRAADRAEGHKGMEFWRRKANETELIEHSLRLAVIHASVELTAMRLENPLWTSDEVRKEHLQQLEARINALTKLKDAHARLEADYQEDGMINQNLRIGAEEYRIEKLEYEVYAGMKIMASTPWKMR